MICLAVDVTKDESDWIEGSGIVEGKSCNVDDVLVPAVIVQFIALSGGPHPVQAVVAMPDRTFALRRFNQIRLRKGDAPAEGVLTTIPEDDAPTPAEDDDGDPDGPGNVPTGYPGTPEGGD